MVMDRLLSVAKSGKLSMTILSLPPQLLQHKGRNVSINEKQNTLNTVQRGGKEKQT